MPVSVEDGSEEDRLGAIAWLWRAPVRVAGAVVGGVIITFVGAKYLLNRMSADRNEVRDESEPRIRSGEETMHSNGKDCRPPSGTYTRETLPPPCPEVQAMLDRASSKAKEVRATRARIGAQKGHSASVTAKPGKRRIMLAGSGKRKVNLT